MESGSPSVIGEFGDAVVGRVFGVEGGGSDITYYSFELTGHSPGNAAIRSALIPGWGQTFNRQRTKGVAFFLMTVGAGVGSYLLYEEAKDSYDKYQDQGVKDSATYDDYTRQRDQSLWLGIGAAALYGFGIYDAYKNAYSPLYSKTDGLKWALSPDGGNVRWERHF